MAFVRLTPTCWKNSRVSFSCLNDLWACKFYLGQLAAFTIATSGASVERNSLCGSHLWMNLGFPGQRRSHSSLFRASSPSASAIKKRPRCCSGPLEVQFQGSSDGVNWITLYSTTTVGSVGEVLTSISSNLTTDNYQQHRFAIQSQGQPIAVAQAQFNVATTGDRTRNKLVHPARYLGENGS
jgi:hypothetical protein